MTVERAPFHRGAYLYQLDCARRADAWIAEHDPDGGPLDALIGTPEIGGRRGSGRSEITPAFLYYAAMGEPDPDEPTVTLSDGTVLPVGDFESLHASDPRIDHVTQHATVNTRDRGLMTRASITTVRTFAPCESKAVGRWATADRWETVTVTGSWRVDKRGRTFWKPCPTSCPTGCKADHKHTRHNHRDIGFQTVTQRAPYGEDGLSRGTVRTVRKIQRMDRPASGGIRWITEDADVNGPASKRQGRRTARAITGRWEDSSYPAPALPAVGSHTAVQPVDTAVTVAHRWATNRPRPDAPDIDRSTIARHGFYSDDTADGFWSTRMFRPFTPTTVPHRPTDPRLITVTANDRTWHTVTAEHETLADQWTAGAFILPAVKADKPGPVAVSLRDLTGEGSRRQLARRIAADPATVAMANRILAAAEHAWTTNGQPVKSDKGLMLTVSLVDGRPFLTVTRDGQTVVDGTYKARASIVRHAVAVIIG